MGVIERLCLAKGLTNTVLDTCVHKLRLYGLRYHCRSCAAAKCVEKTR